MPHWPNTLATPDPSCVHVPDYSASPVTHAPLAHRLCRKRKNTREKGRGKQKTQSKGINKTHLAGQSRSTSANTVVFMAVCGAVVICCCRGYEAPITATTILGKIKIRFNNIGINTPWILFGYLRRWNCKQPGLIFILSINQTGRLGLYF